MPYTVPYAQGLVVYNSNPYYCYNSVSDVKNNNVLVRQLGTVDTIVTNVTATQINNNAVQLLGYYQKDDNGGSTIVWSATSTAADDNATVFKPSNITGAGRWIRQFVNKSANVKMWGTKEDGITDDQPALQNAINYCSLSGINNLYFNSANYYLALSGLQTNSINHNTLLNSLSAWYPKYKNPYPAANFVGGYLDVGYYPQLNYYFNLNLIGTGSTRLFTTQIPFKCYNDTLVCKLSDSTCGYNGIFFLSSNLTACNISGFTLESTSLSSGNNMYANGGIIMGGYSPVQVDSSYFKPSKVKTIAISNNKFINCHSAIKGGQYSSLSGTSLQTLNITNNTFKYPRGSDVINFRNPDGSGGTIVTLDNTAIQNLNVVNNFAEGTSLPFTIYNSNGNLATKDGFMFGSAINSLFQNNTLSNFGVEAMFSNILGFSYVGPYTNIVVPSVGQPLTVNFKFAASNWTPYTAAQYLCASFIPSKYYDLAGDGYGGTNTSLGIYQLQQLLVPTLSNVGLYQYEFSATFVCVSGILGTNSWYNQYLTPGPGLTANAYNFFEYNPTSTYGITVSGIGNNVYGGGFPWRSDMGNVLLSGNNFFISTSGYGGFNLFPFEHADPKAYQILTNNNYYMYNELPTISNYVPTCISIATSGSQIYNNNLYLWVDGTNASTAAVNTYMPQIYNNCDESLNPYVPANGYTPTYYNPISLSYGTIRSNNQVYNNNIFISNPLSAQLVIPFGSNNSSVAGYLTANNIYNNNIIFNNVDTVNDLRNVYSTNFNVDGSTAGGGRYVTLSAQNITINTNNRNTPGDGLGGTFIWVANSILTDDGVSVIKPNKLTPFQQGRWILQYTPPTVYNLITTSAFLQVNNTSINTSGYFTPNDSGGGILTYNSASLATVDNGSVLIPNNVTTNQPGRWIRQFTGNSANVHMWGARGDGRTNDQPAIQAAIDYCSLSGIPNLYFNSKTYFLSSFDINATGAGPKQAVTTWGQSLFESAYLSIGNWVNTNNTTVSSLNLYGSGATLSATNTTIVYGLSSNCSSTFCIVENIVNCTIDGFKIVNDGYLCGDKANAGISVRGNNGGSFGWGNTSPYILNRDTINITNNIFVNCHRAISSNSSAVSGGGVKTFNLNNNTFLYPKGSDSVNGAGGGQIAFFYNDVKNLNSFNNFVEGTTYVPVNSPNNYPKDGFIFGAGLVNYVGNNTFSRLGVESLYMGTNWGALGVSQLVGLSGYFGPTVTSVYNIPAVGQTLTFNNIWIDQNTWRGIDALTAVGGFKVGSYVAIIGGKYNLGYGVDTTNDEGIYQITGYPYRGWTSYGATTAISIQMTRVSGVDVYPYNVFANSRTNTAGTSITGGTIYPYNASFNAGVSSFVTDNVFTIGLATSTANLQYLAHNPAVRSDNGYTYLSGNKIYGAGLMPFCSVAEPKSTWLIEKNDLYLYNEKPVYPVGYTHYLDGVGGVMGLKNVAKNNNIHFWVDINGNTATTVNSAVPQTYVNDPPNYQPTYYGGFGANYAYWGWNQTPPLTGQTFIDNICYCSVPSMSGMIIPIQGGNARFATNGVDPTSNIYNFVSGNNIVFGP
jgi:hypothetical protein